MAHFSITRYKKNDPKPQNHLHNFLVRTAVLRVESLKNETKFLLIAISLLNQ